MSAASFFLIKEPKRKLKSLFGPKEDGGTSQGTAKEAQDVTEVEEKPTFKKLLANPVNRLVLLGTFLRNLSGSVNTYYVPVFFLKNYPAQKAIFSTINAFSLSVMGMTSGIVAGIISDRLEKKKNYMAKAWICFSGCFVALPLMALATL